MTYSVRNINVTHVVIITGTLNPSLQDLEGRPKRSVSTIVHILNDLLGASPARMGNHARTRGLFQPNGDARTQGVYNVYHVMNCLIGLISICGTGQYPDTNRVRIPTSKCNWVGGGV
jgi:hypothetical protein